MATLHFVEHDGTVLACEIEPGLSIMELAIKNDIPGIVAECGGAAACATCHVFLGDEWQGYAPEISDHERGMLEFVNDLRPESRLGCQVPLSESHHGLVVKIPESQY